MRILSVAMFALIACGGSEAPKAEAPKAAPAKAEAPKAEAPKAEAPKAEEPKAEEPKAEEKPAGADWATMSDEEKMKLGERVYLTGGDHGGTPCVTCHQPNGEGLPGAFPPLKGSKDSMGDCKTHAGHIIKGLNGPITVQGVEYNSAMPPQPQMTDLEIAAVISYERLSWGNDYGWCTPEDSKAAR